MAVRRLTGAAVGAVAAAVMAKEASLVASADGGGTQSTSGQRQVAVPRSWAVATTASPNSVESNNAASTSARDATTAGFGSLTIEEKKEEVTVWPQTQLRRVSESTFADRRRLHDSRGPLLSVQGACHLTYWGFEVCDAVLFTPPDRRATTGAEVMSPSLPKCLKLRYLRSISAADFRTSTLDRVAANDLMTPSVRAGLEQFNALYRDVDHGDSYTLVHDPAGDGRVALWYNGDVLGAVEGREFSEALFSVWFGEQPFMAKLKDDLLTPAPPLCEVQPAGGDPETSAGWW